MKKISMYIMLAVAGWSLTACDESHSDWVEPVVYEQEPGIVIQGFEATPTAIASSSINLGTMTEDAIQLFTLKKGTLPAGVTLENIRLEAKPADKENATAHNVVASEDGMVTKEELAKLVYAFYGKKATERTFNANLYANALKGKESQLITLGSFQLKLTPEKLEDPYYYIFGMSTTTAVASANKYVMTPVEGNDMAYTYTTKFFGSNDMLIWNINYWKNDRLNNDFSKVYGTEVKGSKAESGNVTQGNAQNYFIAPKKNTFYTFTIDLEALTFTWTELENQNQPTYTNISLIGVGGDWDNDIDLTAVDRNKHNWYLQYTFTADTQLKFRANHGWDTNWGFGSADGEWNAANDWAKICTVDAKNIAITAGTYDIYFCDITGAAHFVPVEE